jgi:hypothetical protein
MAFVAVHYDYKPLFLFAYLWPTKRKSDQHVQLRSTLNILLRVSGNFGISLEGHGVRGIDTPYQIGKGTRRFVKKNSLFSDMVLRLG